MDQTSDPRYYVARASEARASGHDWLADEYMEVARELMAQQHFKTIKRAVSCGVGVIIGCLAFYYSAG
jgi:hypothetical protein